MDGKAPNPIQVQIQLTLKDYLQACRAHMGLGYFFFPVIGSLLMVCGIFHAWINMTVVNGIGAFAIGALVALFIPILLRQQFKSNKKLLLPFTLTVSADGIGMNAEYGESLTRWNAFVRFVDSAELFLLYPQQKLYLVFPKRSFSPEQLDEFGRLVRANITPPQNRKRKILRVLLVWAVIIIATLVYYKVLQNRGH